MDDCLIFTACGFSVGSNTLEIMLIFVNKCTNHICYYMSLLRLSSKIGKS